MEDSCVKTIASITKRISNCLVSATLYQMQKTDNMSVLLIIENNGLMMSTHIALQDAIVVRDILNELIEKSSEILS
jgi:Ni2+-binding GTPase involved in maturation of urease and hydrogenase